MAESYVGLPADGSGKKLRTRSRQIGAHLVEEQAVFSAAPETFTVVADSVAPAASKAHLGIFNGAGSGRVVKIRKLFVVTGITVVTGGLARFEGRRTTAQSAGTALTPQPHDTTNGAIPAQVLVGTGVTATDGGLLWVQFLTTDEEVATQPLTKGQFLPFQNLMMEGPEIQELTLREGQGFAVRQTASPAMAVGSLTWICVFTVETP